MLSGRLIESVKTHEGKRNEAYRDHLGHWTIGYGTLLEKLEISDALAESFLREELEEKLARLETVTGFASLDDVRRDTILEMAYQLGVGGCLRFRLMWQAIREGRYDAAASEMLNSRWAREQTPRRAATLAARMRHGTWDGEPPRPV